MSETATQEAKPAKKATEYVTVQMTDGRKVEFPTTRKTSKEVTIDEATGIVTVRFDFINGETRSITSTELSPSTLLQSAGHGIAQKAGDEYSGVKEVDDMVLAVEEIFQRLRKGEWSVTRESGDSTAGGSIVVRALVEHTGKDAAFVKSFLQKKLDKAKEAGQKLSRQEVYNSFRAPDSPVAAIIERMEKEKLAKSSFVSAADLLVEMNS